MDLEAVENPRAQRAPRAPIDAPVETLDETLETWKSNRNIQPKHELAKKKVIEAKREREVKNYPTAKESAEMWIRKMAFYEDEIKDAEREIIKIDNKINEDFMKFGF